jgi:toxin FitB
LAIATRWGNLAAQLKARGKPKPVVDTILGATALEHDLIVATRNVGDYEDMGITILNPWENVEL